MSGASFATIVLVGAVATAAPAQTSPTPPAQERPKVKRPIIHDLQVEYWWESEEERDHREYAQPYPAVASYEPQGLAERFMGRLTFNSGSRYRTKDPTISGLLMLPTIPSIQDDPVSPWKPQFPGDPPPRSPLDIPLDSTVPLGSLIPDLTTTTFTLRISNLVTNLSLNQGSSFTLSGAAINNVGSPVVPPGPAPILPPPPGGPPPAPGPPPPPSKLQPTAAKASLLSSSDSDESDDSDSPVLMGPELAVPLKADVTEWRSLRWLPQMSHLSLYAHVLFGEMTIFDESFDVRLYGIGPRLGLPLLHMPFLHVDATLSAGPGFLQTDIGDTAGLDMAAGAMAQVFLGGGLAFTAGAQYEAFFAQDVEAHGPSFTLGLNLKW